VRLPSVLSVLRLFARSALVLGACWPALLTSGCSGGGQPTDDGGSPPPDIGYPESPHLSLVRTLDTRAGGYEGLSEASTQEDVLGKSDGGANAPVPSRNGSGFGAFRIIEAAGAAGAAAGGRGAAYWVGRIRVYHPPLEGASAREVTDLTIGRTSYSFDGGANPDDRPVRGARLALLGVIHRDWPASSDPVQGPYQDLSAASGMDTVANLNGEVLLPPLPELPEGWLYRFRVTGPPNTDTVYRETVVDMPVLTGQITLADDSARPTELVGRIHNITDYFPLPAVRRYVYRCDLYRQDDGSIYNTSTREWYFVGTRETTGPGVGTVRAFAVWSDYAGEVQVEWWLSGGGGLCRILKSAWPGDWASGDGYEYYDQPELLPDGLRLGETVTWSTTWHAFGLRWGEQHLDQPALVQYQLAAAGEPAEVPYGSFTDTVRIVWNGRQVWDLARGVGLVRVADVLVDNLGRYRLNWVMSLQSIDDQVPSWAIDMSTG